MRCAVSLGCDCHPPSSHIAQRRETILIRAHAGTSATLRGCINDVKSMYALLTECYGFSPQSISVLVDDGTSKESPTGANIKRYLQGMVQASQPGDIAFFHFSGHGTQVRRPPYHRWSIALSCWGIHLVNRWTILNCSMYGARLPICSPCRRCKEC